MSIWYDPEADYLEVMFDWREGFFRETNDDRVMQKVDERGALLGFSVLGLSTIKGKTLDVRLPHEPE